MKRVCATFLMAMGVHWWASNAFADNEETVLVLSPDSLVSESVQERLPESVQWTSHTLSLVTQEPTPPAAPLEAHVLLVPGGEINSSFGKTLDTAYVQALRNAINATQLHYKNADDYVPVSTAQTIDRIQNYLAQSVHGKLSECNVSSKVLNDTDAAGVDYVYRIDLGVNRLLIRNSLMSDKVSGEAEARVEENQLLVKKISVSSYTFADKELALVNQQAEGMQKEDELKRVSSYVVDRLAERLGKKLCQYFN